MSASLNGGDVKCVAGRREPFDWEAFQKDGVTGLVIEAADDVRMKISAIVSGVIASTPVLDFSKDTPSANDSTVTVADVDPASGQVVLDGADTESLLGKYAYELNLADSSDADKLKVICRGQIEFLKGQGGVGVP